MLDELLDIFDRDDNDGGQRRDRNPRERQGGIRGFLSRLFGQDEDDAYEDDRRSRGGDRDARDRYDGDRRRRDRDDDGFFDFGD